MKTIKGYKISVRESPFSLMGEKTITKSYTEDFYLHKEDAVKVVKEWIACFEKKYEITLRPKKVDSDTCMIWCGDKFFTQNELKLEEIEITESFI